MANETTTNGNKTIGDLHGVQAAKRYSAPVGDGAKYPANGNPGAYPATANAVAGPELARARVARAKRYSGEAVLRWAGDTDANGQPINPKRHPTTRPSGNLAFFKADALFRAMQGSSIDGNACSVAEFCDALAAHPVALGLDATRGAGSEIDWLAKRGHLQVEAAPQADNASTSKSSGKATGNGTGKRKGSKRKASNTPAARVAVSQPNRTSNTVHASRLARVPVPVQVRDA